ELKAEEIAIADLVAEGFPRDRIERVGAKHLGFDLRAQRVTDEKTGQIEVRRVEVKGYTRGNPIQLEYNEWCKAQQLAQPYWLYVVWDPLEAGRELVKIPNPAENLDHAKRERTVIRRFEIPSSFPRTSARRVLATSSRACVRRVAAVFIER